MNVPTLLLAYFGALFLFLVRHHRLAAFLIAIQLVSLAGTFFIGGDYGLDSLPRAGAVLTTAVILSLAILPWGFGFRITQMDPGDERKLDRVAKVLMGISAIPFVTLLITSVFVLTRVQDINDFKYTEGVSTDFYYSLPINVRLIILSNYLHNLSYLLIPLHFYYLWRKRFWMSGLCLLFSMNLILYGMTFFSRWSLTHYVLLYVAFVIMLRDTLDRATKSAIKKVAAAIVLAVAAYFALLTERRFKFDTAYNDLVPIDSKIQSPVIYSYVSYLSQSNEYGVDKLAAYRFQTFYGQISLYPVLSLLGQYRIIGYSTASYEELRHTLWPEKADKFSGLACYVIYDYGYIGSLILAGVYIYVIRRMRPMNGIISVKTLFHYVLLIQIPLLAIFYSFVAGILIPYLLMIPVLLYLDGKGRAVPRPAPPRRQPPGRAPIRNGLPRSEGASGR